MSFLGRQPAEMLIISVLGIELQSFIGYVNIVVTYMRLQWRHFKGDIIQ